MFDRFRHHLADPVKRGKLFEDYFVEEVKPILELGGCRVTSMIGTTMDLKHGVDVIIHHKDVGQVKVDLCYDVETKIKKRATVLAVHPERLKTEGLISCKMVELLRARQITVPMLLHGAKALWSEKDCFL